MNDSSYTLIVKFRERGQKMGTLSRDCVVTSEKELESLCVAANTDIETLYLCSSLKSTLGLERLIAPNLRSIEIRVVKDLEVTCLFGDSYIIESNIRFSNDADFSKLHRLSLTRSTIENTDKLYTASSLKALDIFYQDPRYELGLKIRNFENLCEVSVSDPDTLISLGNCDSVTTIRIDGNPFRISSHERVERSKHNSTLQYVIAEKWYPNLKEVRGVCNGMNTIHPVT